MPFKAALKHLLDEIPGALGAIIVDWEGEAVDQVGQLSDYDFKLIGAHYGIILTRLQWVLERTDGGCLDEVGISCSTARTLVRPLTEDYLLLLELDPTAGAAAARYRLRCCVEKLSDEFAL
jgi:predicted regulator of Ras-like GTPase activity (Roadblock/LC7/MglB family)